MHAVSRKIPHHSACMQMRDGHSCSANQVIKAELPCARQQFDKSAITSAWLVSGGDECLLSIPSQLTRRLMEWPLDKWLRGLRFIELDLTP